MISIIDMYKNKAKISRPKQQLYFTIGIIYMSKKTDFLLPTLKRGGAVWENSCILIYKQQSIDINNLRLWQGYILYNSIIPPPLLENNFFSLEDPQLKPKGWENIWIWNLSKCILDHFIIPVPPSYHFPHILLFNIFSLLASSAGG